MKQLWLLFKEQSDSLVITEMLGYSIPELTENQQYLVENVHDMYIKLG